jgi:hypothetical protein
MMKLERDGNFNGVLKGMNIVGFKNYKKIERFKLNFCLSNEV